VNEKGLPVSAIPDAVNIRMAKAWVDGLGLLAPWWRLEVPKIAAGRPRMLEPTPNLDGSGGGLAVTRKGAGLLLSMDIPGSGVRLPQGRSMGIGR